MAQRNAEVYVTSIPPGYTSATAELPSDPCAGKSLINEAASSSWVGIMERSEIPAAVSKLACYFCGRAHHSWNFEACALVDSGSNSSFVHPDVVEYLGLIINPPK